MPRRICGLWQTQAGFLAVVLEDGRPRKPIRVFASAPAIDHFCRWLADIDAELIAPSDLASRPLLDECTRRVALRYRVVPAPLIASLCLAAAIPARSPARAGALVARLGSLPYFRSFLSAPQPEQPRLC
jgi:hypothetical protein